MNSLLAVTLTKTLYHNQMVVKQNLTLYLGSVFVDHMYLGNPDVIDRRDCGLQRPGAARERDKWNQETIV